MKRALMVPQPRFCNLSLLSCTWLLISLHVDLKGFNQAFLAHVLILDVHSRCFPLACPALCRCHGHLCFSHACRRQEPQEPPANNFFQTFLCLPLGCFLLMFVKVFSTFPLPAAFSGAALLANQSIYTCSRIMSPDPGRDSHLATHVAQETRWFFDVFWDVTLCLKRESVSWDVSYIGFLCWYLRFALMFTHVDAFFIMNSFFMSVHFVAVWGLDARDHCGSHRADGTGNWVLRSADATAAEIGFCGCGKGCGGHRLFSQLPDSTRLGVGVPWDRVRRKMRGCQIAEART